MSAATCLARVGLCLALLPLWAGAHPPEQNQRVRILQDQPLADAPGQRGVLLTVHLAPGDASPPHVHAGSVLVYVLNGTVLTQMEGGPEQTFSAGQSWYEPPGVPHIQARSASASEPATLVVWQLLPEGEPVARPLSR